jgi:hypothetical protein
MIAIEADFNHLDGHGRLILAYLVIHERTPFAYIAKSDERIVFVDSGEFVEGRLVKDPKHGWVGAADWDTQDTLRAYPADRPVLAPAGGG